jgi:acyl-CoA reductase-like NAD-dependent aldehyde dehydrogenase
MSSLMLSRIVPPDQGIFYAVEQHGGLAAITGWNFSAQMLINTFVTSNKLQK